MNPDEIFWQEVRAEAEAGHRVIVTSGKERPGKICPECGEPWDAHFDVCRECDYDPSVEEVR